MSAWPGPRDGVGKHAYIGVFLGTSYERVRANVMCAPESGGAGAGGQFPAMFQLK